MIAACIACFVGGALSAAVVVAFSPVLAGAFFGFSTAKGGPEYREGADRARALFEALERASEVRAVEAMAVLQECTQQLRELGGGAR